MNRFWSALGNAFATATEPQDVADLRTKWLAVKRYFHMLQSNGDSTAMQDQLPEIAHHLDIIVQILRSERAELGATGQRPCRDFIFESRGNDSSIFVHACQLTKTDSTRIAAMILHFLVDCIVVCDLKDTKYALDVVGVVSPFMDAAAKPSLLTAEETTNAVLRAYHLIVSWGSSDPNFRARFLPRTLDVSLPADRIADRCAQADDFFYQQAHGALKKQTVSTYVRAADVIEVLSPRLGRQRLVGLLPELRHTLTSATITLSRTLDQVPDAPADLASTLLASLRLLEVICLSTECKPLDELKDWINVIDEMFANCSEGQLGRLCSVVSISLTTTLTQDTANALVSIVVKNAPKLLANFGNVDHIIASSIISLVTVLFDNHPVKAVPTFLDALPPPEAVPCEDPEASYGLQVTDIDRCFVSALLFKPAKLLSDAGAIDRAESRCFVARSLGSQLSGYTFPEVPSLLIKLIALKLESAMDEEWSVNVAVCNLVAALACLPNAMLHKQLFGEHGWFSRALFSVKEAASRRLEDAGERQRFVKTIANDSGPADRDKGLAALVALEYSRQELMAIASAHSRYHKKINVVTE